MRYDERAPWAFQMPQVAGYMGDPFGKDASFARTATL